ncbi:MAG: hypothetical protein V2J24_00145 [Pseudomonadales bacterium]|nr:hypothetical protein [Pseudomonadales bacterium]
MSTLARPFTAAGVAPPLSAFVDGQRVWGGNAVAYALLFLCFLTLAGVDDRLFQDVSLWKKPAKFALSIAIYFATLAWCAALLPGAFWHTVRGRLMSWIAVLTAAFEMVYIALMAGLGEASHFNTTTPFTSLMYSLMGAGAMTLTAISPWLALEIARQRDGWREDPVLLGVVVGLALTFVLGAGAGGYLGAQTSHWVDAPATDAGGLAVLDWSREGGDLRVAHFFGMHVMQALPLFALAVRRLPRPGLLVGVFATLWSAFTVAAFVQAVQGRPFLS